ncbi:hypothetical protein ACFQ9V_19090 [Leifsonia sp. NPDC056665]|uniref:hypothetical protein n=1 Tax=Leifsonia sp. NPDC056665 TaxID=3345901 RepID=UPI00369B5CEC
MTSSDYVARMRELGYSEAAAEDLIWIASSTKGLTQAPFNFVPADKDAYRILQPDGLDGYFTALGDDRLPLEGTLDEAYEYVYQNRLQTRRRYFGNVE